MFNVLIPLVQAPMLGASTPAMAKAASLAGGIGSLAAAGLAPQALKSAVADLKQALGGRAFVVNLFILPPARPEPETVARAMAQLAPYRAELGLPPQGIPNHWAEDFAAQFDALLEAAPPAASFTFGLLAPEQVQALKARGIAVIGTATTLAEAVAWAKAGADALVAQGFEAGGHRGTFLKEVGDSLVGTLALVSAVKAAVQLPVIAAGGVMDGRGIAAMLALGADYVQMGTAFLLSEESAISAPWRAALIGKTADDTALTSVFSGRYARGLTNRFMQDMASEPIAPYPIQNALTQDLRAAAARAGRDDLLSLWAGQGVHAIRGGGTAELIKTFWAEAREALAHTTQRYT